MPAHYRSIAKLIGLSHYWHNGDKHGHNTQQERTIELEGCVPLDRTKMTAFSFGFD
jgi:hypothetical protein